MGTLASHIALLPPILREKYGSSFWVAKANEILERLSSERIMKELKFNRGVLVTDDVWIDPPDNYISTKRLYHPNDFNITYAYEEVDERLLLVGSKIESDPSPVTIDTFSNFELRSITAAISDISEDFYKNYLMKITAGTLSGETIIISGNDESVEGGTTKFRFAHASSSLLDAGKIVSAELISPEYFLALMYIGNYLDISSVDDEVPIDNKFEKRLMSIGLQMKGYHRLSPNSNQSKKLENDFEKIIMEMNNVMLSKTQKVQGRVWAGLMDDSYFDSLESENSENA